MDKMNIEAIVRDVLAQLAGHPGLNPAPEACDTIPVEMSARHVHLSQADAIELFGAPLTPVKELSQPGQYLCRERVRLIGPKGVMGNVAVLGPSRDVSQVEISLTDARALGIDVPIRQSGDLAGTPGILLSSGKKIIPLDQGVIVAGRHIHMSPDDARALNVTDRELVAVLMEGRRPAVFRDVLVRVHKDFRLAMHIDADEANGCGCGPGTRCRIVKDPVDQPATNGIRETVNG